MSNINALAVTSRTATILIAPEDNQFTLAESISWTCSKLDGEQQIQGITECVTVFLDDLQPSSQYTFVTKFGSLTFQTKSCTGLINVCDYGANPELADNRDAFTLAIADVPQGGTLYIPSGRFVSGPLFLRGDMTLYLAEHAEIWALASRESWPILAAQNDDGRTLGTWEGLPEHCFASLITAIDCDQLTLTGKGCIDGGGDRGDWWSWPKETRNGARRPRTIMLSNCTNPVISGLTVRNSPSWTIHPVNCVGLLATALTIENPADSPNTDGLNPESCLYTRIKGVRISVGDDCIAIKSGKRNGLSNEHLAPTRHMEISNCLMQHGHGAVVLGSEMSGGISDISISQCEFIGTDRGLRIKTRRGRGGSVSGISIDKVTMQGVATPLVANAFYFCDADGRSEQVQSREPAPVNEGTPQISDISITNVTAYGVQHAAAAFYGLPEAPLKDIRIEEFVVTYDPDAQADVAVMASNVEAVRHAGILTEFADVSGDIKNHPRGS